MPPVPPELSSWVSFAKDVATLIATTIGGVVAVKGLNAWRRQLKGKTDYELARKVLRASYKVRDAIGGVRRPFIDEGEFAAAEKKVEIEDPELRKAIDAARLFKVYKIRWDDLMAAMSDLEAEGLEAEVSWGAPIKAKVGTLRMLVAKLHWAVGENIRRRKLPLDQALENKKEVDSFVFDLSTEEAPDQFSAKVQQTVSEIEGVLKPHLR